MAFRRKQRKVAEEDTGFSQQAVEHQRVKITPVDVQQKVFRLAFRGYNEQDVDQFLDEVTEDLAALHEENKRLREELELRGPGGGTEDARRHAEEIIRNAREEAARIAAAAPAATPAAAVAATPAFLVREREFLQRLASLVQEHAASLKAEARRAREAAGPEGAAEPEQAELEEAESEGTEPERSEEEVEPNEVAVSSEQEAVEREVPADAEPPLDRTAPMPPPGEEEGAWSNPFESAEDEGSSEEEPSLRELFWGEE